MEMYLNIAGMLASVITIVMWAFLLVPSWGRTHYPKQWENVAPEVAQWYKAQVVPGSTVSCCSQSDATHAVEERKQGHYWVKFEACGAPDANNYPQCTDVDFMEVPDQAVLKNYRPTDPRVQLPVVWWYWQDGRFWIRCYAPEPDA